MADHLSPSQRSRVMARIHGRNTQPELAIRSIVHRMGYRYRLHVRALPGCPDLVFPKYKAAMFVHGCFWHQHRNCPRARKPRSNIAFWSRKLSKNALRDRRHLKALQELGWKTLVIWQCEIKNFEKVAKTVRRFLRPVH
jgi:DNA mismatch endonuclease, patch repair protein